MKMTLKLSIIALLAMSSLQATTLNEAVQKGIESDPAILAEAAKYDGKKVSVSLAKSGYYPSLDVGAGIGYEETDRENPHSQQSNEDYTRTEASARFRQPLFEGFSTSSDVARSRADKEAVGYELITLFENKSLKIIKAYLDVLKAQEVIALAETNLQTHNDILKSIEQRYKQGVSDKADLIQIKGRFASAKTDLYSAKNNALDAEAVYLKTVGENPDALESLSADTVTIPLSLEEAIAKSEEENPTMLAARKNIELVESQRDGMESGYYPHVFGDLSANYKDDADGIEGTQETYQAMLRLEWNLFNGFKETNQREIAQKEVLSAQQKAQDTKRELVLEATLSWNAYTLLTDQLVPLQEHVDYAKEAHVLYLEQYDVGRRSLIDVLNSQVESFNAAKTLIAAQHDEIAAKYRVLNSMGILNDSLGVEVYQ